MAPGQSFQQWNLKSPKKSEVISTQRLLGMLLGSNGQYLPHQLPKTTVVSDIVARLLHFLIWSKMNSLERSSGIVLLPPNHPNIPAAKKVTRRVDSNRETPSSPDWFSIIWLIRKGLHPQELSFQNPAGNSSLPSLVLDFPGALQMQRWLTCILNHSHFVLFTGHSWNGSHLHNWIFPSSVFWRELLVVSYSIR